jgi:hypothetical protein
MHFRLPIFECRLLPRLRPEQLKIGNCQSKVSFGLFVTRVLAATAAELLKLETLGRSLLVLGRDVVATFAIRTLQHYVIARHNSSFHFRLPIFDCQFEIDLRSQI